ncbi:MAG: hypothetical protein ACI82I_002959 [Gammaproteobacteria bacterium]|jgi:hypothetical protein
MLRVDFNSGLERCSEGNTSKVSLPPVAYRDADVMEMEFAKIFQAGWFG